jgi:hypothetical protein
VKQPARLRARLIDAVARRPSGLPVPRLWSADRFAIENLDKVADTAFERLREPKKCADRRRSDTALQLADEHRIRVRPLRQLRLSQTAIEPELAQVRTEDFPLLTR